MMKNIKKKKGFTLIELIIVIAIIGILAAIAVPKFGNIQRDAKTKADVANAKVIVDATIMLIGKDEITLPASGSTVVHLGVDHGGAADDTTAVAKANNKIVEYLQNVPTPKATTATYFTVTITSDGTVTATATP